jgi:hypothetical protein
MKPVARLFRPRAYLQGTLRISGVSPGYVRGSWSSICVYPKLLGLIAPFRFIVRAHSMKFKPALIAAIFSVCTDSRVIVRAAIAFFIRRSSPAGLIW